MTSKTKKIEFKENFEIFKSFGAFYTGGPIQFTKDGLKILSLCQETLKSFEIEKAVTTDVIEKINDEDISAFLLADDDETLVTAAKSGIMRHYSFSSKTLKKTWKSLHIGPVSCMAFDSTVTLLATGGTDSTIKVWDIIRKYYTHNLKGGKGVYSKVCFQVLETELYLFGAADDYLIHVWKLSTGESVASLEGHYSTVNEIVFTRNNTMISSGRDKVVLLWSTSDFKLLRTIPVYETVEACILAPADLKLEGASFNSEDTYFITAGDKGVLKVWSTLSGNCIYSQSDSIISLPEDSNYDGPLIKQAIYVSALEAIAVTTFDHNIILYSLSNFSLKKQFVGYNDDILSIKFLGEGEKLAVATNSTHIKILDFPSFNCRVLKGHLDIVLALDVFPKHKSLLVSASKDNNVKVWFMDSELSITRVYTGYGHTASVTAVSCCRGKGRFFATGSEDTTLKLWEVPKRKPSVALKLLLAPYLTVKAHDKNINSIDISENDKLIATGSQDHTAKIWDVSDLSLVATLRGHKKGVWCVNFSPVDLAVATSSGDETIRIWSLSDFSCLKVFEGHEASVLQIMFLTRGTQLISSASDGNIKLWDIKNNMCIKTLSEHTDKVWTLASSSSENYIVSGGADSNIIIWEDTTEIEKEKTVAQSEEFIMQEQNLLNYVKEENWSKALSYAITLEKPHLAYTIIEEILLQMKGECAFEEIFSNMRSDQRETLLKFSSEWITNAKYCYAAVLILNLFFRLHDFQELSNLSNISFQIRDFLPYLDRHYKRLLKRCQDMQIINFLHKQMTGLNTPTVRNNSPEVNQELENTNCKRAMEPPSDEIKKKKKKANLK
ncbi:transducin beta-like protein 3 [Uloborus diversus]|uniref:transducin beta-like protein 3 n=1 Tax=Uloborus diversus TaxID=327109 RepID=UPI00240A4417|nr:transducin beta-like protein 3 [Uloborus diversus]